MVAGDGGGSGSIISQDGTILTNFHVVQGQDSVDVIFKPPGNGEIAAADRFKADVLKVDEVADLAIGHPLGEFWTYTRGSVSQVRDGYQWLGHSAEVIQTQTPINPGNSGGPLFSDDGKIIGINSFTSTEAQGINFAVSVGEVRRFMASKTDRKLPEPRKDLTSLEDLPIETFDLNENGEIDTYGIDANGNGVLELYIVDENEDGQVDYYFLDQDENGLIDTKFFNTIIEGEDVDIWLYDDDEDGEYDVIGIDLDQDGTPDRYQPLTL